MTNPAQFEINVGLDIKGEWHERPLDFLAELTKCTETLIENLLREGVAKARQQGHTWEAIGGALGVSRQAAWERFAPAD